MDDGQVAEFDTPLALLNGGNQFAQMVKKTGADSARNLCQIANEAEQRFKNTTNYRSFIIAVN